MSFDKVCNNLFGKSGWFGYAISSMLLFSTWGVLLSYPSVNGFPSNLSYVVWAVMNIPFAYFWIKYSGGSISFERNAALYGILAGVTSSLGILMFMMAAASRMFYAITPIVSLSPVIAVVISLIFLRERLSFLGFLGLFLSFISLFIFKKFYVLDFSDAFNYWFVYAFLAALFWGLDKVFIKVAVKYQSEASVNFYLAVSSLLVVPFAYFGIDFNADINWGWSGFGLSCLVQFIDIVAVLFVVYASKLGKASVIAIMTSLGSPALALTVITFLGINRFPATWLDILGAYLALLAVGIVIYSERHRFKSSD